MLVVRILFQIIGTVLVLFGLLGILTPIPLGFVFFIIGLMFLIPTSPLVVRIIQKTRRRYKKVDGAFDAITHRLPLPYRRILKKTEVSDPYP